MNGYVNARFGRAPVGSMASQVDMTGPSVAASGGLAVSGGQAPVAVACLAAIGFLVVFYWGTRKIQGLR